MGWLPMLVTERISNKETVQLDRRGFATTGLLLTVDDMQRIVHHQAGERATFAAEPAEEVWVLDCVIATEHRRYACRTVRHGR